MDKIARIINEWDPINFYPMAPLDEYSDEIQKIFEYISINKKIQVEQLAQVINEVFLASFGRDVYEDDMERCEEIARRILS